MDKRTIYAEFDHHRMQAGLLSVVISFALSRGIKPNEIEDSIGYKIEDTIDPDLRLDEECMPRLWKAISEREAELPLPLDLAKVVPYTATAGLFYGFQYASDLQEAIQFLASNRTIMVDRLLISLEIRNGEVAIVSGHPSDHIDSGRSIEFGTALLWRILNEVTSDPLTLLRAEFSHGPGCPQHHYETYFDAPVIFNQPQCALVFERKYLSTPVTTSNPELFDFAKKYFGRVSADISKQKAPDDLKQLQKAIVDNAITGDFSSRSAALRAQMSLRSAQRLSKANGLSLNSLIEKIRTSGAKKLLSEQNLNIETVAEVLGYSDDRAFRRAFKRWTGETPSSYRRSRNLV